MEPVIAFTVVMLIWTLGEFVSAKTNALISMMLVASVIFLVGFTTDWLPHDLIKHSGLLNLGNAVIGVIIVHLGTMMSFKDLKAQWRTFIIGSVTVVIMTLILIFVGELIFDRNVAVSGTAAITGGTLSVLMIQNKVTELSGGSGNLGMLTGSLLAVFPLLILNLKNLLGFLTTSVILRKEAQSLKMKYRQGELTLYEEEVKENEEEQQSILPEFLQTAYGTLFMLGATVCLALILSQLTDGYVNMFVIALLLGIVLRHFKILKPNSLSTTDSFGLLMISIMVIAFGPLADIVPADLLALIAPIVFYLAVGALLIVLISYVIGKIVGYSGYLAMAVGLTTLFGFPGTMVLTKEAAEAVGESKQDIAVIEQNLLPIMVTAGFSTITITSVLTGGIIVGLMIG